MSPQTRTTIIRGGVAALLLATAVTAWLLSRPPAEQDGFVRGNGRVEATQVDVATRAAGRVDDILVNEGDFVRAGDIVARMDVKSLEAQHAQALAEVANARSARQTAISMVAQREADVAMAEAVLVQRRSELDLARRTSARSQALLAERATSEQIADDQAARVRNAGAIFIGRHTPEVIGDYVGGSNHVLPTARSARFSSGLSVLDFVKRTSILKLGPDQLAALAPAAVALARAEGLEAHARSVAIRTNR